MHEIGILYSAAETAVRYADQYDMDEIHSISLELGELAGVLPNIFTDYFDYVKREFPKMSHAELFLKIVPGEAMCEDCQCMYNVMKNEGKCPNCESKMKTILSGRDVRLMSIS